MPSVDGQPGIRLADFMAMWQEDGTKLVEQDRCVVNGMTWLLYAVYFPESTWDHGRHMAMLLKVDTPSDIILLHDLKNITGEVGNYRAEIDKWFQEHVGKY
mgnify:FL=1